jgi:hypothetical protein
MKEQHIESAKQIVKQNGECDGINCYDCPFINHQCNLVNYDEMTIKAKQWLKDNGWKEPTRKPKSTNKKLLQRARWY